MLPICYSFYMPDTSSHVATRRDDVHTIPLAELEATILEAGIVMSRRQITRHCKSGTFDAIKLPAANNVENWYIAPSSVEKGIADIKALRALRDRHDETRRDVSDDTVTPKEPLNYDPDTSRHDATRPDMSGAQPSQRKSETQPDTPGQGSETEPATSRYVAQLEKRIEEKDDVIGMLRGELAQRNDEIVRRNERERETNILIRGLQNLVLQLQPGRTRAADVLDDDPLMAEREGATPSA